MRIKLSTLKGLIEESFSEFAPTASEEAKKINAQAGPGMYGMTLVTDQDFWEKRGVTTGEELAFTVLSQTYSDLYKSLHGIRPRWARFENCEQVQAAIEALDQEAEAMAEEQAWEAEREAEWEAERKKIADLQAPGCDLDYEKYPTHSGFGRRVESTNRGNVMSINKRKLRKIVKESVDQYKAESEARKIVRQYLIKEEAYDCWRDYKAGTLTRQEYEDCVKRFEDMESGYSSRPSYSSRKTTFIGSDANEERIKVIEDILAKKDNKFLSSILTQLRNGRGLSSKQNAIVQRIVKKSNPEAADLFDGSNKAPKKPGPKWQGTKEELRKRVHRYLIDIGFYKEHGDTGWVNPFSKGDHPKGGYTSNIPDVIKDDIKSGKLDWATWDEIYPTYRRIDRSID